MPDVILSCHSSSSRACCPDTVTNFRIVNNTLQYFQGDTWIVAGSVCCNSSSSSSSSASSPASSSADDPTQTTCCDDPIPETVFCTLANSSGCECLHGVTVALSYDPAASNPGISYYAWTGQEDACSGFVHVTLICFTPGAFPYGWRLSVRCNGVSNTEFDVQANGKTCPESGPLEITFGPMVTEADTCCTTGSSTFTATVTE